MEINRGFGKRRQKNKIRLLGAKKSIINFYLPTTILSFEYMEIGSVYYIILESVMNLSASFPKLLKSRTM